ncbi:alpha/beta fold hydrolase [Aliikangiella sp. G2MR2-5]|uniref:alpha/beta fold hydrolase n=1 Tax=Aliikangiella sp. G2MR2-5 TaxID=2788943 RepID=UPI0018AA430D|nr:alpha/beta hydrolase [Aliikangiella sp. G2MR2-5]
MKRFILIFIGVLTSTILHGKEVKQDWTSYAQSVNVKQYIGKRFAVSAAIRMRKVSPASKASLWVRIDKNDGYNFFKNDAGYGKVDEDWKHFKIEGVIQEESSTLNFGALCFNNGDYFFDDFELKIENDSGQLVPVEIKNEGFEGSKNEEGWNEGIVKRKFTTSNFKISYSSENPYKGNFSLRIQADSIPGNMKNGKYVKVNGVRLYYEEYGEGEPLLLIHGNGQSISAFINQIDIFSKKYRVIALDSRGRGNSSINESEQLTYTLQAKDTKLFLDKIGIESAHIVGWSDGGIIGLILAMKYPEKVKSLVSMAANVFPEGLVDLDGLKEIVAKEDTKKTKKYSIGSELIRMMIHYPQLKFEDLSTIKAPTLIIAGDKDQIKTSHTVKISEAIKESQLAILPNTDHYMPRSSPKIFNETVLRFLETVNISR